jgi:hypothetical protein
MNNEKAAVSLLPAGAAAFFCSFTENVDLQ